MENVFWILASNNAARSLCGHADCHSLCGPAQIIENEIGQRAFPSG